MLSRWALSQIISISPIRILVALSVRLLVSLPLTLTPCDTALIQMQICVKYTSPYGQMSVTSEVGRYLSNEYLIAKHKETSLLITSSLCRLILQEPEMVPFPFNHSKVSK